MLKINNVKVGLNETDYDKLLSQVLNLPRKKVRRVKLVKKSVDARRNKVHFICAFVFETDNEKELVASRRKLNLQEYQPCQYPQLTPSDDKIIVVGSGPAGLFCAYNLARSRQKVILIEQGEAVEGRQESVERFLATGELDFDSNVQFGEGGAGTFSDGKLTTGIKDFRKDFVLETFVNFGSHEDILYDSMPHIGSDVLVTILKNMRQDIIANGGEVRFNTKMTDLESSAGKITGIVVEQDGNSQVLPCDKLVLALGHSARSSFKMLESRGLAMEAKPFAVGLRIEHTREFINQSQFGPAANHPALKAASYKMAVHPDKRGVYTFCMCPGGTVMNSSSHPDKLVVNGMSNYARDEINSNSAILVTVNHEDYGEGIFAGVAFQEQLEAAAFILGGSNYHVPVENIEDYLGIEGATEITPSAQPGYVYQDLSTLFSDSINAALRNGLTLMDKKIPGFTTNAVLSGVESRSSSPIRIYRDQNYCSNIEGVYPIGEGAGYAGGIMSSAIDGLKCSEFLVGGREIGLH